MFPGGIGFYGNSVYGSIYGQLLASYGSLNLTVSSPIQSFIEPLSLAEVKAFLAMQQADSADGVDDDMIESTFIPAARDMAEYFQGKDLVLKQFDLSLDYWSYRMELRSPLVSVDLIQYLDSTGAVFTLNQGPDYIVDTAKMPGIVMPPYLATWPSFTPWPSSAILIRFTCGLATTDAFWSSTGKRIKMGMLYLISGWYEGRLPLTFGSVQEIPFAISSCLGFGRLERVR